jgi:subtilisin family serine protease
VDIFAPGSDIHSAAHKGGFFSTGGTSKSGTSMAAPFVAGAAALFLEQNPALTPAEVRQQLIDDHGVRNMVGDARGSSDVMVSTGALYEASAALSSSSSEMCSGVFGYCGGGVGCCGDKFCLPVFGLCFIF